MKSLGALSWSGLLAVCALLSTAESARSQGLDENLPAYTPKDGISGTINLVGSATMSNVADVWRESFLQYHRNVRINIDVKGSINAVGSVADGSATFGLLSRAITAEEVEAFEKKFNYPPKILIPAQEMMAVFVNKENPIEGMTLEQVAKAFAADSDVKTWGDLGVGGTWAAQPIDVQGRSATTGSTLYMQSFILRGHPFKTDMKENESNMLLVDAVAASRTAIGYAGMIYSAENVRAVPLAARADQAFVDVNSPDAALGKYPLMRPLQLVVKQAPGTELSDVEKEFLRYVFSRLGQEDVIKGGFQPIPGPSSRFALDQVGLRELN